MYEDEAARRSGAHRIQRRRPGDDARGEAATGDRVIRFMTAEATFLNDLAA
jgi:hypothetical protein